MERRPEIDLGPLLRPSAGCGRMLDTLRSALQIELIGSHPPCDSKRPGEDAHRVTLAVASSRPGDPVVTT
jgi:hypothetical protein